MTRPTQLDKRKEMLKEMFAEIGEGCYIEPPLHANMAGAYVYFGKNVYANFNKCSKNSPTSSGGEMNCTSEHICSKKLYSIKETLVLPSLM